MYIVNELSKAIDTSGCKLKQSEYEIIKIPKVEVASSNLVSRSNINRFSQNRLDLFCVLSGLR